MFTGKARKDTQSSPSELVKDLEPAIERLILRCLEDEPRRRPQTPLNVAMALPGADPIAAALAAGETPSPEMVAASEEKEGFGTLTAVLCFAAMVLALVAHAAVEQRWGVLARAQIPYPPQVLADRAQHLLDSMGYTEAPLSVSYGFYTDERAINNLGRYDATQRTKVLASHQPPAIIFWYQQNQIRPGSRDAFAPDEPDPGSVRMTLDAQSRLVALSVRPWQMAHESSGRVVATVDWPALFSSAGLNMARFASEPPEAIPPMMADARLSWAGTYGENRLERVRVNAASWRGRPVLFEVLPLEGTESNGFTASFFGYFFVVVPLMVLVAAVVAFRNVRQGRVDRRGAGVIGGTALAIGFALPIRAIPGNVVLNPFLGLVGVGVLEAGGLWLLYIAIEPYVRRNWPDSLISWSRFCTGRVRNALVASHILAGLVLVFVALAVRSVFMAASATVFLGDIGALDNFGNGAVSLLGGYTIGVPLCLGTLLLVVLLRLAVRRVWIADWIAALVIQLPTLAFFGSGPWRIMAALTYSGAVFLAALWLLRRLGFLAFLVFWVFLLMLSPQVFMPTGWTAGPSIGFRVIPLAVAAWALWVIISTERRPSTESTA
jgi:serine/threonine-protein kinase